MSWQTGLALGAGADGRTFPAATAAEVGAATGPVPEQRHKDGEGETGATEGGLGRGVDEEERDIDEREFHKCEG